MRARAISRGPRATLPARASRVAVVAQDDLLVRRVREALAANGIAIGAHARDPRGLPDGVASLAAVILAGGAAGDRKTVLGQVARRFPALPLIVIARNSSNGVRKAVEAGAAGYVVEAQVETTLACTVRAVQAGQLVLPRTPHAQVVRPALSNRERQTLALVVMGLTNREIADRLFVSESTVKTHMTSIFGKLAVGSRSEAVALVLDPDQKLGLGILGLSPAATPSPEQGPVA